MSLLQASSTAPGSSIIVDDLSHTNGSGNGNGGGNGDGKDPPKPALWIRISASVARFGRRCIVLQIEIAQRSFLYCRKIFRNTVSTVLNGVGFLYSFGVEYLLTSRSAQKQRWWPLLNGLKLFLQTSGIYDELERGFNARLLNNISILSRFQNRILLRRGCKGSDPYSLDRRVLARKDVDEDPPLDVKIEGQRYVKYAVAAYGSPMMDAAEISVYGEVKTAQQRNSWSMNKRVVASINPSETKPLKRASSSFYDEKTLRTRMSEHIGISQTDIYMMNMSDDEVSTLRHFVAVDHERQKVVLSIRGTLTLSEVIMDIGAFSTPFCGGEAHSEMARQARDVWNSAKSTVMDLLQQHDNYTVLLTGHSLGAGAATLLNILLHHDAGINRKISCLVFASPPVFTPLGAAKEASRNCVNYIHDLDCVPFLSIDSIRHIFAAINDIDKFKWSARDRSRVVWGRGMDDVVDLSDLLRVERSMEEPLSGKKGAPVLVVPAYWNIWMRENEIEERREEEHEVKVDETLNLADLMEKGLVKDDEAPPVAPFNYVIADSNKLATIGIYLSSNMINHHFPNGYEASLQYLQ